MAGERKGKAYEAIVYLALCRLFDADTIHWNVKPKGMTIEPDFTVGGNPNQPDILFLVTQTGAAGYAQAKFWRNIGELFEAKVMLSSEPKVYSITFDAVIKDELTEALELAMDGAIVVGRTTLGAFLSAWIDENLELLPKGKASSAYINEIVEAAPSSDLAQAVSALSALVAKMVDSPSNLDSIWGDLRRRSIRQVEHACSSSLRKGVLKVLLSQDITTLRQVYSGKILTLKELPAAWALIGIVGSFNGIATPDDDDVQYAFRFESKFPRAFEHVLRDAPMANLQIWIDATHASALQAELCEFLSSNLALLSEPETLCGLCLDLCNASIRVFGREISGERGNWLFLSLHQLCKAVGRWGIPTLAQKASSIDGMPAVNSAWYRTTLPAWYNGRVSKMPRENLKVILNLMSEHLSLAGQESILAALESLKHSGSLDFARKVYEYPHWQPTEALIRATVNSAERTRIPCAFVERANGRADAGTTIALRMGDIVFKGQSCTDAGRDHKRKELCGRAVAMRYTWDSSSESYGSRPGTERLILILDGTWRQNDVTALLRSGWDEIYFPDEMDKLSEAMD